MSDRSKDKMKLVAAMTIFGSIGIFRKYIPYSSGMIAFARGLIGVVFLGMVFLFQKRKIPMDEVRRNGLPLVFSGALLGINWILLFEAYRYTAVSVATVCYYVAPLMVVLVSPVVLHERLTARKVLCAVVSTCGLVLVSGVSSGETEGMAGILLALAAAVTYAAIIMLNKIVCGMEACDRTVIQLAMSAVVLFPYVLMTEDISMFKPDAFAAVMLLITGIVHTGIAYSLYFSSIKKLPAQTVALFSYIDPTAAVVLSAVFLHERISFSMLIGIVLVLGASAMGETGKKIRL